MISNLRQSILRVGRAMSTVQRDYDLIFIRHAHSYFNEACEAYRKRKGIPWNWDILCSDLGFQNEVAYNRAYIDSRLTPHGIQQCLNSKQQLDLDAIDLVLVSPQQRALETCSNLFKARNIPTMVMPELTGPLWSACDISKELDPKKQQFSNFDFSGVEAMGPLWFIGHLCQSSQKKIKEHFDREQPQSFKEQQEVILKLLSRRSILQTPLELLTRVKKLKETIQKLHSHHSKIAIISHFYTIQYLNSRSFNENGQPLDNVNIKNCEPYYSKITCHSFSLQQ